MENALKSKNANTIFLTKKNNYAMDFIVILIDVITPMFLYVLITYVMELHVFLNVNLINVLVKNVLQDFCALALQLLPRFDAMA